MADIGEITARLILKTDQFSKGLDSAKKQMEHTGKTADNTAKSIDGIQSAALGLGAAVGAVVAASVGVAANFESSMAKLKAITNANEQEFNALSEAAKELGATTAFSTTQASDAMYMLAAAGYDTNQIIEAMPGMLNLAAAAQVDLAKASEITTSIMSGFGIEASKTAYIADVLATAANKSNSSIPDLGEAMKYVGPVAKALGLSLEETAASIGILSNNGIKGSEAGTALRASLLSLANPTGQTVKALKALGIEVTTADGKMKPLPELIGHIGSKLSGMEDAQKTATVAQLVGTEAASGFLALLDAGEGQLTDFSKELKNSGGTAEKVAKTQMSTLKGSFEEFKGALEKAGIEVSEEFLPLLTDIVKDVTDVIRKFDDVNIKATLAFGGATAAVALLGVGIYKVVDAIKIMRLAFASNPLGLALTAVSLLTGALISYKIKQEEASKVTFDHYNELGKQQSAIGKTITSFDELRGKCKLSNDELLEYMDKQQELQSTTDPQAVTTLTGAMEELQKKSGLSKEELEKLLKVNSDLIEQAPNTEKALSKSGSALATNTKAAKNLNSALLEQMKIELELQELKMNANVDKDIGKYQQAVKDVNNAIEKRNEGLVKIAGIEHSIYQLEEKKKEAMKLTGNQREIALQAIDQQLELNKFDLQMAKENQVSLQGQYLERTKGLSEASKILDKDKEIYNQLNQNLLKQAGLTSEVGKEKQAIDAAIKALEAKKAEIQKNVDKNGQLTQKQIDQIAEIDKTIGKYKDVGIQIDDNKKKQGEVNGRIKDGKNEAEKLQTELSKEALKNIKFKGDGFTEAKQITDELGKPVKKEVTIWEKTVKWVEELFGGSKPKEKKHTGGIVGAGLPKYHSGGVVGRPALGTMANPIGIDTEESKELADISLQMMRILQESKGGFHE